MVSTTAARALFSSSRWKLLVFDHFRYFFPA